VAFCSCISQLTGWIMLHDCPFGQHIAVVFPARDIHVVDDSQQKFDGSPWLQGMSAELLHPVARDSRR